jgi:hypothetical protein
LVGFDAAALDAALFPSWLVRVPSATIFLLDDDIIWLVFFVVEVVVGRLLMVHGVCVVVGVGSSCCTSFLAANNGKEFGGKCETDINSLSLSMHSTSRLAEVKRFLFSIITL